MLHNKRDARRIQTEEESGQLANVQGGASRILCFAPSFGYRLSE